jgi:hypothetical protein
MTLVMKNRSDLTMCKVLYVRALLAGSAQLLACHHLYIDLIALYDALIATSMHVMTAP